MRTIGKIRSDGALPDKSYFPLAEAAVIAGCKPGGLLHSAVQGLVELIVGVPEGVNLRVYDEQANSVSEPFLMKPEFMVLKQSQCLKIELHGKTQQSDFPAGYLLEQNGDLKRMLPSYGRPTLNHSWVYWRLIQSGDVCLLTISAEDLFVRHADLVKLMEPATKSRVQDHVATKAPRSEKPKAMTVKAEESGSADIATANDSGSTSGQGSETKKSPTAMVQKSRVEEVPPAVAKVVSVGPVILRLKEVMARTGLSRSTIYDRMSVSSPRHDPSFPRQRSLGGDSVGWVESEVFDWIQTRVGSARK